MNRFLKQSIITFGKILPDETYLKTIFFLRNKKWLNLTHPQTYNEKVNWLKLHDHNPLYSEMVNKKTARNIAAQKIGLTHVPVLLGCWDKFEDIDFNALPGQFVLKCTHDSGSVIVCKNKQLLDRNFAKKKLNSHLERNAFYYAREWPYKDVKPQIIAEELLTDKKNAVLPVYKFFCFDGEPKIIQCIHNDKQPNETVDYLDTDWIWLDLHQEFPKSPHKPQSPTSLKEMINMARILSKGFAHVRVDFYEVNQIPYFSEFTFYNDAGLVPFYPAKWNLILGNYLTLPKLL